MDSVQANRLVKLAQYLETMPKEDWNYESIQAVDSIDVCGVYSKDDKKVKKLNCHTTACAIGSLPTLFPNRFKGEITPVLLRNKLESFYSVEDILNNSFNIIDRKTNRYVSYSCLSEFLGLTEQEISLLFYGDDTELLYGTLDMAAVTSKQVAKAIYDTLDKYGYEVR